MVIVRTMSCAWPVDRSCLPPLPELPDNPTQAEQDSYDAAVTAQNVAEDLAVQVLWSLSGRQFGACETVVRPCPMPDLHTFRRGHPWDQSVAPYVPTYESGRWINYPCGCVDKCRQAGPRVVHLPGPISEIVTVTVADQELDPDEYALEETVLYRVGANWPHQDYNKPLGESGTWSVTYLKGIPVPAGAGTFVGQLAKEFLAACSGEACRLPRNVVAVTNRGVTRQFDPSRIYAAGKTGMSEIDMWLAAVNPYHLTQGPKVI